MSPWCLLIVTQWVASMSLGQGEAGFVDKPRTVQCSGDTGGVLASVHMAEWVPRARPSLSSVLVDVS